MTETEKWKKQNKKKNETTLFDRNPQQLSEGFSSENKMQRRFEKGGRRKEKKNTFCFLVPDLGMDEIRNRGGDRTGVIEGLGK